MHANYFKVPGEISELVPLEAFSEIKLPLFESPLKCGFPSPAEDYIRERIDLNRELIRHPDQTFLGRADTDSMEPAIFGGEMLVIDSAVEIYSGNIVLAELCGEFCVKEFAKTADGGVVLLPRNRSYDPIFVTEEMDFKLRGRVMYSIKSH